MPRSRATITEPTTYGTAQLVPDARRVGGWTLLVDGVPQSHVNLPDPARLEFAYMRMLAAVVDAGPSAGAALHLGGGALTLPRYLMATRPDLRHVVVERDAALLALVQRELALPDSADIALRVDDARAAVEGFADASFDLVIADVYQAAQMPPRVASVQFAQAVARILRTGGVYATNVVDLPPLTLSRIQAATLRAVFDDVCVIAEPSMLRGRRYGNVVLAAGHDAGGLPVERIARRAGRDHRVLHGAALAEFVMGTGPMVDA